MATNDHLRTSAARTQATFREVNYRIRKLASEDPAQLLFATDGGRAALLCECADMSCMQSIEVPLAVFDQVRLNATHFVVSPGHLVPEIEHVIGGDAAYAVVEKFGEAGTTAAKLSTRAEEPR